MILEKIVVGPLSVNCYLLGSALTKEAVIIDPGDELNRLEQTLEQKHLNLKYILL